MIARAIVLFMLRVTLRRIAVIIVVLCVSAIAWTCYVFVPALIPWEETGRLVVVVRGVEGDTSPSLSLTMDTIELVRADGGTEHARILSRRVTLDPQTSLPQVVCDAAVRVGVYTSITFTLTSPTVQGTTSEKVVTPVTLPSEHVLLPLSFQVEKDETTALLLGIETTSMHPTQSGTVFLPIVMAESRKHTELKTVEDGTLIVSGGTITQSATYGMDAYGEMRINYRAPFEE